MMTKEEILNAAKKWEDFCIALRRDFHESPELSGQETQTIARICTELRAVGLSPIEVQDGGVLAVIEGDAPGQNRAFAGGRGCTSCSGGSVQSFAQERMCQQDPRRVPCVRP